MHVVYGQMELSKSFHFPVTDPLSLKGRRLLIYIQNIEDSISLILIGMHRIVLLSVKIFTPTACFNFLSQIT